MEFVAAFYAVFAPALWYGLHRISQWPRAGDFIFRGLKPPVVTAEAVTLPTDYAGLV